MLRPLAGAAAGIALVLTVIACSGDDDTGKGSSTDGSLDLGVGSGGDSDGGQSDSASSGGPADLPGDPCAVTKAALQSVGWTIGEAEVVEGPGGPDTQCTWSGEDTEGNFRNGWVMFIPGSQIGGEYHEDEAIDGVGADAFRGSPQSGELLVTGADPAFRIFLTGGLDNDADVVAVAKAVVSAG